MARLPSGQHPYRQTSSWTDYKEDRTKREHNPELTEPIEDKILCGQNVMWPEAQVDGFKIDKHQGGLNPN